MNYRGFSDENYECRNCEKEFTFHDVRGFEDWRCPECNSRIIIKVKREKFSDMLLERKLIEDVRIGDYLFWQDDYKLYEVLGKQEMSKNRVKLMLRGYGGIPFPDDEYINCLARFDD